MMHKCDVLFCSTGETPIVAMSVRRYTEEGEAVHKALVVCEPHARTLHEMGWPVKAAA